MYGRVIFELASGTWSASHMPLPFQPARWTFIMSSSCWSAQPKSMSASLAERRGGRLDRPHGGLLVVGDGDGRAPTAAREVARRDFLADRDKPCRQQLNLVHARQLGRVELGAHQIEGAGRYVWFSYLEGVHFVLALVGVAVVWERAIFVSVV